MQPSLFLSQKDHVLLTELLYHRRPGLIPAAESVDALSKLLAWSHPYPHDAIELSGHVGLGDRVRLEAPENAADFYEPSIVLPADADLDTDRLSILTPIGFAVIGRKIGDLVSWETPRGLREMKIASLRKLELAPS